jgi:hypothetical protein
MKRTVLLLIFGTLAISCMYGQKTYYYRHVEYVRSDGSKSKGKGGGYLTFTDRMNTCYQSDENGYKKDSDGDSNLNGGYTSYGGHRSFHYQKSQSGTLVYDDSYVDNTLSSAFGSASSALGIPAPPPTTYPATTYFYFNSDYSKLVVMLASGGSKYVYERTDGPYDEDIPVF